MNVAPATAIATAKSTVIASMMLIRDQFRRQIEVTDNDEFIQQSPLGTRLLKHARSSDTPSPVYVVMTTETVRLMTHISKIRRSSRIDPRSDVCRHGENMCSH
ncbi:hypothetical protein DJ71_18210 [Halorubrum sp. E3]|nr:hypothetical protein DJ71_18210 [Halorubrum sp. E3]OYR79478.1 hypothetical protein DJ72_14025 [Halorubrum distributum]